MQWQGAEGGNSPPHILADVRRRAALLLAHPDFQSWRHPWATDSVPFQRGPFSLNSKVSLFFLLQSRTDLSIETTD